MSKSIVVRVPPWLPVEEAKRIIEAVLARLGGRVDVAEVRGMLGVKPEELTKNLKVHDARGVEA